MDDQAATGDQEPGTEAERNVPTRPAPRVPPPTTAPRPARPHSIGGPPAPSSNARGQPSKRGRPVITVVDAKPMNQVGFRDVSASGPPASPRASTRPEITIVGARPMNEVGFREDGASGAASVTPTSPAPPNSGAEDSSQTEVKAPVRPPPSRPKVPPVRPPSVRHSIGPTQKLTVGEPPPPYDDKPLPSYEDVLHETGAENPVPLRRRPQNPGVDRSARATSMYARLPPPRPVPRQSQDVSSSSEDLTRVSGGAPHPSGPPVKPRPRPKSLFTDESGAAEPAPRTARKPMGVQVLPVPTPQDAQPSEVTINTESLEMDGIDAGGLKPIPSPRPKPSPCSLRKSLEPSFEHPQQSQCSDVVHKHDPVLVIPASAGTEPKSSAYIDDTGDLLVKSRESEAGGSAAAGEAGAVTRKRPTIIRPNRMKKSVSQDFNAETPCETGQLESATEPAVMKTSDSMPSIANTAGDKTSTPPVIRKNRPTIIRAKKAVSMMELGETKLAEHGPSSNNTDLHQFKALDSKSAGSDSSKIGNHDPPPIKAKPVAKSMHEANLVMSKSEAWPKLKPTIATNPSSSDLSQSPDQSHSGASIGGGLSSKSIGAKDEPKKEEVSSMVNPKVKKDEELVSSSDRRSIDGTSINARSPALGQSDIVDNERQSAVPQTHPKPPPPVKPKPATKPKPAVAAKPKPATLPKKSQSEQNLSSVSQRMPGDGAVSGDATQSSIHRFVGTRHPVEGSDNLKEVKENVINEERESTKFGKPSPPPVHARPPSLYSIISGRRSEERDSSPPADSEQNVEARGMKKSHTFPVSSNANDGIASLLHDPSDVTYNDHATSHVTERVNDSFDILCDGDVNAGGDDVHHESESAHKDVDTKMQPFEASNIQPQVPVSLHHSPDHQQELSGKPPPLPPHSPKHRPLPPSVPPHSPKPGPLSPSQNHNERHFRPDMPTQRKLPPPVPQHSPDFLPPHDSSQRRLSPLGMHHSPEQEIMQSPPPPVHPRQQSLSPERDAKSVSPPPVSARRPQPPPPVHSKNPSPVPSHCPPLLPPHSPRSAMIPSDPALADDGPRPPLPARNPVTHSMSELPTQSPVIEQLPSSSTSLYDMPTANALSQEAAGRTDRAASLGAFDFDILEGKSQLPVDPGAKQVNEVEESVKKEGVMKRPGKPPRAPPPAVRTSKVMESPAMDDPLVDEAVTRAGPPPKPAGPTRPPGPAKPPPPRPKSTPSVDPASIEDSTEHGVTVRPSRPGPPVPRSKNKKPAPSLPPRPTPGHPLFHYVVQGPHGIALYDFDASQDDELSFKAGDVILLDHYISDDWLVGRNVSKQGMFPSNFVDVVETPPHIGPQKSDDVPATSSGATHRTQEEGSGPRCRARFDFEGESDGDLSFSAGDLIQLVEQVGDEWLIGEINGHRGMFPVAFVEVIEGLPSTCDAAAAEANQGLDAPDPHVYDACTHIEEHDTKAEPYCIALYDFSGEEAEDLRFSAGDRIVLTARLSEEWLRGRLHGKEGSFPAAFVEVHQDLHDDPATSAGSNPPSGTVLLGQPTPLAKALYDFSGETDSDLVFKAGDLIVLADKIDSDWLKGRLDGHEGMFPAAFVEIIHPLPEEDA